MQMRKLWWRMVRDMLPCNWCGKTHTTRECDKYFKSGKLKKRFNKREYSPTTIE